MKKAALKRSVDLLMTAALLALMSYSLIGEAAHEWIGVGMAPLFILHLGLHWTMVLNAAQPFAVTRTEGFRALGALTALYGAYAFWKRGFPGYLLLRTHFLFLDYEEPTLFFFLDYLAVMGLFVFCAHCGSRLLLGKTSKKEADEP